MIVRARRTGEVDRVRLSRACAAQLDAGRCISGATARSSANSPTPVISRLACPARYAASSLHTSSSARLPWKDVVMPAVPLAEQGFTISAELAKDLNTQIAGGMKPFPASVAAYGKPGGGQWVAGDRLVLVRSRQDAPRDRHRRRRRVLQGLDRRSHRRGHEGERRPHHERGSRRVPGQERGRR